MRWNCVPDKNQVIQILGLKPLQLLKLYNLFNSACDADGNNSRNSYLSMRLNSHYIHFHIHKMMHPLITHKNWVHCIVLYFIKCLLVVFFFSCRVKFCIKYGGRDIPLTMIPGNQRCIWKIAKKCCLNSEKKLWTISLNLLKKTYRCVSLSVILKWRQIPYLGSVNGGHENGRHLGYGIKNILFDLKLFCFSRNWTLLLLFG